MAVVCVVVGAEGMLAHKVWARSRTSTERRTEVKKCVCLFVFFTNFPFIADLSSCLPLQLNLNSLFHAKRKMEPAIRKRNMEPNKIGLGLGLA